MKNRQIQLLTALFSLLLALVTQACNLYNSAIPGENQSFLCANEKCTIAGGKS